MTSVTQTYPCLCSEQGAAEEKQLVPLWTQKDALPWSFCLSHHLQRWSNSYKCIFIMIDPILLLSPRDGTELTQTYLSPPWGSPEMKHLMRRWSSQLCGLWVPERKQILNPYQWVQIPAQWLTDCFLLNTSVRSTVQTLSVPFLSQIMPLSGNRDLGVQHTYKPYMDNSSIHMFMFWFPNLRLVLFTLSLNFLLTSLEVWLL
jgi:hypothetical protein